jgi:hypothetical protein
MYMNTYMTSKKEARQRAWLRAAARADAQRKVHQRDWLDRSRARRTNLTRPGINYGFDLFGTELSEPITAQTQTITWAKSNRTKLFPQQAHKQLNRTNPHRKIHLMHPVKQKPFSDLLLPGVFHHW